MVGGEAVVGGLAVGTLKSAWARTAKPQEFTATVRLAVGAGLAVPSSPMLPPVFVTGPPVTKQLRTGSSAVAPGTVAVTRQPKTGRLG